MEEILMNYLVENCAIVVPVLWCIGAALKRTPKVADWLIPYLLGAAGITFCLTIALTTGGSAVMKPPTIPAHPPPRLRPFQYRASR